MVVSTQFFHLIVFQERVQLMCNHTKNDAIWGLIVLFLTNQIAGNTIHFKMNVINFVINWLVPGVDFEPRVHIENILDFGILDS